MTYTISREKEIARLRQDIASSGILEYGKFLEFVTNFYRTNRQELSRDELRSFTEKVPAEQLNELYFTVKAHEVFPELERAVFRELRRKNVVDYEIVRGNSPSGYVKAFQNPEETSKNDSQSPLYIVENGKVRQPMLKENLEMRLNDLETLVDKNGNTRSPRDRIRLFMTWLDSCTGVAYNSKDKNKFKIVLKSPDLINLSRDVGDFLSIDYAQIDGEELRRDEAIYREGLTSGQIIEHKGWLASVGGDKRLLEDYVKGLQEAYRLSGRIVPDRFMGFYIRPENSISQDQLRALFVDSLGGYSGADDSYYLYGGARFLRVSLNQPKTNF